MSGSPISIDPFYAAFLNHLIGASVFSVTDSVLVICGDVMDRNTLLHVGFTNVTISNLGSQVDQDKLAPYGWCFQDAECLSFPENSFDVVIVHSGLHHCYSPHRALAEMVRVSRKCVLGFEPYENRFTRLGTRLGYGQIYETAAVFYNNCQFGGVANTEIPNYVYRFSEHEIRKVAACLYPWGNPKVHFARALRVNVRHIENHRNPFLRFTLLPLLAILQQLAKFTPALCNNLAFAIEPPSPENDHPWIERRAGIPRLREIALSSIHR